MRNRGYPITPPVGFFFGKNKLQNQGVWQSSVNWYVSQYAWRLDEGKADFDADDGEDNDDDDGDEEFLVVFPVPCSLPSPPSTIGLLIRILGGGAHWGGGGDEDGGDDANVYAYDIVVGQKTLRVRVVPMVIFLIVPTR